MVDACLRCNNDASPDEQYVACLVDCVIAGSSAPSDKHRDKVRRTLEQKPALQSLIDAGRSSGARREILWTPDPQRVKNIVLKLARGHVAYEYSETQTEEPEYVRYEPLPRMSEEQVRSFEQSPLLQAWPEIGSRAFMRAVPSQVVCLIQMMAGK